MLATAFTNQQGSPLKAPERLFIQNKGQWNRDILFQGNIQGNKINFLNDQLSFSKINSYKEISRYSNNPLSDGFFDSTEICVWNVSFLNKNPASYIDPLDLKASNINYLIGDKSKWSTNTPTCSKIKYKSIYRHIDIEYYHHQNQLKYDIIVFPEGSPDDVKLVYNGIKQLKILKNGDLEVTTPIGKYIEKAPFTYQEENASYKMIASQYKLLNDSTLGFSIDENYDKNKALIIDPFCLEWATYVSKVYDETGHPYAISATDNEGNGYISGYANGFLLTTPGVYKTSTPGASDTYITKISNDGSDADFITYFGGSQLDWNFDIQVDNNQNVYLTGVSHSDDFPFVNSSGFGTIPANDGDVYLTVLNDEGTDIVYSTLVGGDAYEVGEEIAIQGDNVYVGGKVQSNIGFPVTSGVSQTVYGGGNEDGFVFSININTDALNYCTYLGGSLRDEVFTLDVDNNGDVYAAGFSTSTDYPGISSGAQTTYAGGQKLPNSLYSYGHGDGTIVKLNSSGAIVSGTYLGGSDREAIRDIEIINGKEVVVTGYTQSTDFPITANVLMNTFTGDIPPIYLNGIIPSHVGGDNFLTALTLELDEILKSTYFGTDMVEEPWSLQIGPNESYIIAGQTMGNDLVKNTNGVDPICPLEFKKAVGSQQNHFLIHINSEMNALDLGGSTYVRGESASDYVTSIGYSESTEEIIMTGIIRYDASTGQTFPTTAGSFQQQVPANAQQSFPYMAKFKIDSFCNTPLITYLWDTQVCANTMLNISPSQSADHYQWTPTSQVDCKTCSNVTVSPKKTTDFRVYLKDSLGCAETAERYLVIIDSIRSELTPAIDSISKGESALITIENGDKDVLWHPVNLVDCEVCHSINAFPDSSQYFYVTTYDAVGCSKTDSIYIFVDDRKQPFISNVVQGSNNELFTIGYFDLFRIYDRHGKLVFETRDPRPIWIPQSGSKVYTYYAEYTLENNVQSTTGTITVLNNIR